MLVGRRTAIALGASATAWMALPALARTPAVPDPAALHAIETLLMRFVWGLDTADPDAAAAPFSRDAVIHDADGKTWRRASGGAGAFVRERIAGAERGAQHHLQINRIERAGERWQVESYWSQAAWKEQAPRPELLALGSFVDQVAERGGDWRIIERRVALWNSETVRVPVVSEP
jgi:hypothetical protein